MQAGSIVAIDAGNTAVKLALLCRGKMAEIVTVPVSPSDTFLTRLLSAGEQIKGAAGAEKALISSVRAETDAALKMLTGSVFRVRHSVFLKTGDIPLSFSEAIEYPGGIGIDRLICAYGALRSYGAPCIVVGAGTAITVDLIGDSGKFEGGAIAPGFQISARALAEWTSALPEIRPALPEKIAGHNTEAALISGIFHSCAGGVAALVKGMKGLCRGEARVVLTGGDADLVGQQEKNGFYTIEKHLLIKSMWHIYEYMGVGNTALRKGVTRPEEY